MKDEAAVQEFLDDCKAARGGANLRLCSLYPYATCDEDECSVPKFIRWLQSDVVDPADTPDTDE